MKTIFTIALFIFWLGVILAVPVRYSVCSSIEGVLSITGLSKQYPEFRKWELCKGIFCLFMAIVYLSIAIICALLPFAQYF